MNHPTFSNSAKTSKSEERSKPAPSVHFGKTVLITGAGGCIGSALAKSIVGCDPRRIVLLDHSEQNLYEVDTQLSANGATAPHVPVLGDI